MQQQKQQQEKYTCIFLIIAAVILSFIWLCLGSWLTTVSSQELLLLKIRRNDQYNRIYFNTLTWQPSMHRLTAWIKLKQQNLKISLKQQDVKHIRWLKCSILMMQSNEVINTYDDKQSFTNDGGKDEFLTRYGIHINKEHQRTRNMLPALWVSSLMTQCKSLELTRWSRVRSWVGARTSSCVTATSTIRWASACTSQIPTMSTPQLAVHELHNSQIQCKTRKASCRWQTRATLAKRLHGLCKSSGVISCIASLPIDSLPMVSY